MAYPEYRWPTNVRILRRASCETYFVRVYVSGLCSDHEFVSVEAIKSSPSADIVRTAVARCKLLNPELYELAEVFCSAGQQCKERRLEAPENPVKIQLLWPKVNNSEFDQTTGFTGYRYFLRRKDLDNCQRTMSWQDYKDLSPVDSFLASFLRQSMSNKEYTDLCNLPDLNEKTLMENIRSRFNNGNIYTYVGSILIAVNPFKFFPIYNPKYVKLYQNKRLADLPPHIFAIADAAFHQMLRTKNNQCIVISGESGSGKTESTNLLLHHLTALTQKGLYASGVEQTILGAGPVLEAFGNAKTVHNNNSSRFGKFIQINFKENGMVHGAIVEKYLLEKSRIVSQAPMERNYHVFYYLLAGADESEKAEFSLTEPEDYQYLRQSECYALEGEDPEHEFSRLKQSMELVGFSLKIQQRICSVLSAVLHLGNVEFRRKEHHHDESVAVKHESTIKIISDLLHVKEKTLIDALTQKKATAGEETVVMTYRMSDAIATRDALAKCLYGALFDWILLKVNHALLAKRHNSEHKGNSIGVLDIFGFEDFQKNSFEQFCINYANEHLQYYFNQHIFKFEQEEYLREGIEWKNIDFIDNTGCLELFSRRNNGLFLLIDEECNFPGATNETLLNKFQYQHRRNPYYSAPQLRESAFVIEHYAGPVKYDVTDFREKNNDLVRMDIVGVLKNSGLAFVRELMGVDPVAVLRWTIIRAFFRGLAAFRAAGKCYAHRASIENIESNSSSPAISPEAENKRLLREPLSDVSVKTMAFQNGEDDGDTASIPIDTRMTPAEARVMRKASKVLMKNKSFKNRVRSLRNFHDIRALKTIASRTMFLGSKISSKKQPPSVGAQFQWSLTKLMETLNQANPYFIRCIKSNTDKAACRFDDSIVLRQLRYTGMLATVRIRQSGYNYRLTFDEFTQMYKILLPRGVTSTKRDIIHFLQLMHLNKDNYQIGINKVFLREAEKTLLDEALHQAIMARVTTIQRWMKTIIVRQNFMRMRSSAICLQPVIRMYVARRVLLQRRTERDACITIQTWFRTKSQRRKFLWLRRNVVCAQSVVRGFLARKRFLKVLEERRLRLEEEKQLLTLEAVDARLSTSDKGSSAEELEIDREEPVVFRRDSEESSGILEDSEVELASPHDVGVQTMALRQSRELLSVSPVQKKEDEDLQEARRSPSVHELAKSFETAGAASPVITKEEAELRKQTSSHFVVSRQTVQRIIAPLAKQESISDLMFELPVDEDIVVGDHTVPVSPYQVIPHLSPEQVNELEAAIARNNERSDRTSSDDGTDKSPAAKGRFHIRQKLANIMGGKKGKKDLNSFDESDEEKGDSPYKKIQEAWVPVLPVTSPRSLDPKSLKKGPLDSIPIDGQFLHSSNSKKKKNRRGGRKGGGNSIKLRNNVKDAQQAQQQQQDQQSQGNWNVARRTQWQYPATMLITDPQELRYLDDFLSKKIKELKSGKRDTIFDMVFKKSLRDFHNDMKGSTSIAMQDGIVTLRYRDLMSNFEQVLMANAKQEGTNTTFPLTLGANAFRGFLDEFIKESKKRERKEDKKVEMKNVKREKRKDIIEYQGHRFQQVQFNIPTFCEFCNAIMWIMEKGQVCQLCKYTCHKRCYNKSSHLCKTDGRTEQELLLGATNTVFGAPLHSLLKDGCKVPPVIERLIMAIEIQGLYTEGIYRKCGTQHKIRMLKQMIDNDPQNVDFSECQIHVMTTTLKYFFREMPVPLLTYELYDDFIRASQLGDEHDCVQALYAVIDRLPKEKHGVLERLIFHLARVAQHESSNKMSPNGLAIVFAPCLLRTKDALPAQISLNHVQHQTACIEYVIMEQLRKLKTTLADISTLENAQSTAFERLSMVRAKSKKSSLERVKKSSSPVETTDDEPTAVAGDDDATSELDFTDAQEEKVLSEQIRTIEREKNVLTYKLPVLECPSPALDDDEDVFSADTESVLGSLDDNEPYEEYAITLDLPATAPRLKYLNKIRARPPQRKRVPKRFKAAVEHAKRHCSTSSIRESTSSLSSCDHYDSTMSLESSYLKLPSKKHVPKRRGKSDGDSTEIMV